MQRKELGRSSGHTKERVGLKVQNLKEATHRLTAGNGRENEKLKTRPEWFDKAAKAILQSSEAYYNYDNLIDKLFEAKLVDGVRLDMYQRSNHVDVYSDEFHHPIARIPEPPYTSIQIYPNFSTIEEIDFDRVVLHSLVATRELNAPETIYYVLFTDGYGSGTWLVKPRWFFYNEPRKRYW